MRVCARAPSTKGTWHVGTVWWGLLSPNSLRLTRCPVVVLAQRKKAASALEKQKSQEKKQHEEWLASMDEETRARYIAEQDRKQRYV